MRLVHSAELLLKCCPSLSLDVLFPDLKKYIERSQQTQRRLVSQLAMLYH